MATCNTNTLLSDGKCFAALPLYIQQAISLQLWCAISGGVVPPPPGEGNIVNPEAGGVPIWNPEAGAPLNNPQV